MANQEMQCLEVHMWHTFTRLEFDQSTLLIGPSYSLDSKIRNNWHRKNYILDVPTICTFWHDRSCVQTQFEVPFPPISVGVPGKWQLWPQLERQDLKPPNRQLRSNLGLEERTKAGPTSVIRVSSNLQTAMAHHLPMIARWIAEASSLRRRLWLMKASYSPARPWLTKALSPLWRLLVPLRSRCLLFSPAFIGGQPVLSSSSIGIPPMPLPQLW